MRADDFEPYTFSATDNLRSNGEVSAAEASTALNMPIICDKTEAELEGPLKDLETLAIEELGETPEVKQRCLAELRQLLEGEDNLRVPQDDAFLLMFLRARKYRVNDALKRLKNYFRVRKQMPEYFEDLTPSSVPYQTVFYDHKLILSSKKRDPLRRAIGYVRFGAWNSDICSMNELVSCVMMAMECNLLSEETQIRGAVGIIDMEGFSAHHLITLSPWFLRRVVTIIQDSLPVRIKGLYFVNTPAIFTFVYSLIKSLMSAKLRKRLRLLGSDFSTLGDILPSEFIPKEYGGEREDFDYQSQETFFQSKTSHFEQMRQFGYSSAK